MRRPFNSGGRRRAMTYVQAIVTPAEAIRIDDTPHALRFPEDFENWPIEGWIDPPNINEDQLLWRKLPNYDKELDSGKPDDKYYILVGDVQIIASNLYLFTQNCTNVKILPDERKRILLKFDDGLGIIMGQQYWNEKQ